MYKLIFTSMRYPLPANVMMLAIHNLFFQQLAVQSRFSHFWTVMINRTRSLSVTFTVFFLLCAAMGADNTVKISEQ